MDVQTPETPGRFSLRLDVYSPSQVLQIVGRLGHLVLASLIAGEITNSRAPSLHAYGTRGAAAAAIASSTGSATATTCRCRGSGRGCAASAAASLARTHGRTGVSWPRGDAWATMEPALAKALDLSPMNEVSFQTALG